MDPQAALAAQVRYSEPFVLGTAAAVEARVTRDASRRGFTGAQLALVADDDSHVRELAVEIAGAAREGSEHFSRVPAGTYRLRITGAHAAPYGARPAPRDVRVVLSQRRSRGPVLLAGALLLLPLLVSAWRRRRPADG